VSTTVEKARRALVDYFAEESRWRGEKALEYPDDRRNALASSCLANLAGYVRDLPESDSRLVAVTEMADFLLAGGDVFSPGPEAGRLASRYGFDRPSSSTGDRESETEFLDHFIAVCQQEAMAFAMEQLDQAASSEGADEALDEFKD
jgi:hypothetical protein